jgi:hypothetical protein
MDNPNVERLVSLCNRTCKYANIQSLEENIRLTRQSLVARSSGEGNWSESDLQYVLTNCAEYEDMLDEHAVWSAEIQTYFQYLERDLREKVRNLPNPFGSDNG